MPYNLDQLDFLGTRVGVAIPPEFIENKRREADCQRRAEEFAARAEEMSQRHDGPALETILQQATAAIAERRFADALDLFEQFETGLNAPDLPPPPIVPPPVPPREQDGVVPPPVPPRENKQAEDESQIPPPPEDAAPLPPRPEEDDALIPPPPGDAAPLPPEPEEDEAVVAEAQQKVDARFEQALNDAAQRLNTLAGQADGMKARAKFATTDIDGLLAAARAALANRDPAKAVARLDALEKLYREIDQAIARRAQNEQAAKAKALGRQKLLAEQFSGQLQSVKKSYFTEGAADRYGKEKLKAGKEFKTFLDELKLVEAARAKALKDSKASGKPVPVDVAALEAATRAYIKHFDEDLSERERKSKESQRKKQICETTLVGIADWKLAEDMESLGAPPWDELGEAKANALFTKMLFEEDQANPAAPLGSQAGVSAAFWVERTDFGSGEFDPKTGRFKPDKNAKKKQFIFKPMDGEAEIDGFPEGGSAIREVMAMSASNAIQSATGIDFNMPPTTIVAIDNEKLGSLGNAKGEVVSTRIGSMQKFSRNKGVAADVMDNDPALIKRIASEETQKLAILDLVSLNLDRHAGNVMIDDPSGKGTGPAKLVPIDHGLVFPSREALQSRRTKMSPVGHNVIGQLPGSDEKFSADLQEKIQLMDPDEIVEGMKKSLAAQAALHPGANFDQQIGEENFKLVRRSVEFLKRAASELTPAELFDAYSRCLEQVFDSAEDAKEDAFAQAIETAKQRSAACKELGDTGTQGRKRMFEEIQERGWAHGIMKEGIDNWMSFNAELALRVYKSGAENPAIRAEVTERLQEMGRTLADFQLENKSLKSQWSLVGGERSRWLAAGGKPKPTDDALQARFLELGGQEKLKALFKAYSETACPPEATQLKGVAANIYFLESWEQYEALGGDAAFDRLALSEGPNVAMRYLMLQRATGEAMAGADLAKKSAEEIAQAEPVIIAARVKTVADRIRELPKSPFREKLLKELEDAKALAATDTGKARAAIIAAQNNLVAVHESISVIQVPLDFLTPAVQYTDCARMVALLNDAKQEANLGKFDKAAEKRVAAEKIFMDSIARGVKRLAEVREKYPKDIRPPAIASAVNNCEGPLESAAIQSAANHYRTMEALEKAIADHEAAQPAKKSKSSKAPKPAAKAKVKPAKPGKKRGSKK